MTETTEADRLVASLTAALDEEEAAAKAVEDNSAPWDGQWEADENLALRTRNGWVLATALRPGVEFCPGVLPHIARQDPARTLRRIAAHREILDRYAGMLRDYAWSLKQARGGPIANADLDAFEAELPVLRSIVEIIAGIYEEPTQ